jgi:hypothetical protein
MADETKFDPRKHLIQLKGKLYLETRWRVAWFREDHARGSIMTEVISYDPVLVKATVLDENANILSTGHAGAKEAPNSVWSGRGVEKAETAAIGRALGHAGYGTQFASEGDAQDEVKSGHLADRPVERRNQPASARNAGANRAPIDAAKFFAYWTERGVTDQHAILAALGVTDLRSFSGTREEAIARVSKLLPQAEQSA